MQNTHDTEVVAIFKKAAREVDNKELKDLDMTAKISTLGIDSVAMLEVIGYFEEELDIHLPDEKLARVETLRDLADLIQSVRPAA